jgi:hypothetical protein
MQQVNMREFGDLRLEVRFIMVDSALYSSCMVYRKKDREHAIRLFPRDKHAIRIKVESNTLVVLYDDQRGGLNVPG